jgi:hypothetical protein
MSLQWPDDTIAFDTVSVLVTQPKQSLTLKMVESCKKGGPLLIEASEIRIGK